MPRTGVMLFTRDLRLHDNPALAAATSQCERVVPLFVLDDHLLKGSANRTQFLLQSLVELRADLGGKLVVRRGDVINAIARFDPDLVYMAHDVSPFAHRREERIRQRFSVRAYGGITVVAPGDLAPAGSTAYRVFSPYWRAWWPRSIAEPARPRLPLVLPSNIETGAIPEVGQVVASRRPARRLPPGGERAGSNLLDDFLEKQRYEVQRNELGAEGTSRLSPYLHFGCLSPSAVARAARSRGLEAFLRQLCWRDFYAQLLAARPALATNDLRPAGGGWLDDADTIEAWKEGRTGYPVVDAAMRQLLQEGWIHNRGRLVAASFLTHQLAIDWRVGAHHFMRHLVDGDVASNSGNWQWVAGTGTDARPARVFNPVLQGRRYDPTGAYSRRFVHELASVGSDQIQDPTPLERQRTGYPAPVIDHAASVSRWRRLRALPARPPFTQ